MTSFSTAGATESQTPPICLPFPTTRCAHLQIYTGCEREAPLQRVLRLTGSVAYNGFHTTPVISQFGGPVQPHPGDARRSAGERRTAAAVRHQSRLFGRAFRLHQGERRLALADKNLQARGRILYHHSARRRRDVEQAESDRAQARADLDPATDDCGSWASSDPGRPQTQARTSEIALLAPSEARSSSGCATRASCCRPATTQCFTHLRYEQRLGSGQRLSERFRLRAHRATKSTINNELIPAPCAARSIPRSGPRSDHAHAAGAHRAPNPGEQVEERHVCHATVRAGAIVQRAAVPDAAVLRDTAEPALRLRRRPATSQFARRMVTIGEQPGGKTQIATRTAGGRPHRRRRQPLPAVPELVATVSRTGHVNDPSRRPIRAPPAVPDPDVTRLVIVAGTLSFQRMPVDAYPDLSPPMVEVITQWPGHAAEEVERLITLPDRSRDERHARTGVMRSISLVRPVVVIMTFEESTDDYFARQVVFERIGDAQLPAGVTPAGFRRSSAHRASSIAM